MRSPRATVSRGRGEWRKSPTPARWPVHCQNIGGDRIVRPIVRAIPFSPPPLPPSSAPGADFFPKPSLSAAAAISLPPLPPRTFSCEETACVTGTHAVVSSSSGFCGLWSSVQRLSYRIAQPQAGEHVTLLLSQQSTLVSSAEIPSARIAVAPPDLSLPLSPSG